MSFSIHLRHTGAFLVAIGATCLVVSGSHKAEQMYYQARATVMTEVIVPQHGPRRASAGEHLGRIDIPRIGLTAAIAQGTDERSLRVAVGHIESTAMPGQNGNVGLAAHRDSFFRNLGELKKWDRITVATASGKRNYYVESTAVVDVEDVDVLEPDGSEQLTLVTCFPFHYIGPAPKRFIVVAK